METHILQVKFFMYMIIHFILNQKKFVLLISWHIQNNILFWNLLPILIGVGGRSKKKHYLPCSSQDTNQVRPQPRWAGPSCLRRSERRAEARTAAANAADASITDASKATDNSEFRTTAVKLPMSRSQLTDGQKALLKKKSKQKHSRSPRVNCLLTPQKSNLSRSPHHWEYWLVRLMGLEITVKYISLTRPKKDLELAVKHISRTQPNLSRTNCNMADWLMKLEPQLVSPKSNGT